ncbi:hypothetical protein ASG52_02155 [Methylobacterium sp. Leaf456]|uniref:Hint domain-containing protein n=1 Tax=Methylobacterium sp. Leaf456 TaxID=1736382 RepID=UPI0006FC9763|nr:Hint domain-containing protein [Methylobacterium sp. Leaf456]KQT61695.1 hypothetical protein ASG52_02155 [Methylobacterium sp. Leaf456]
MAILDFTGGAQYLTITQTGTYNIVALGAQGGSGSAAGGIGGLGASMGASFNLTAGQHLKFVVGGQGGNGFYSGGGGGGTFVFIDGAGTGNGAGSGTYKLLLAAGGGGGGYGDAGTDGTTAQGNGNGGSGVNAGGGSGYKGPGGNSSNTAGGGQNRTGSYAGGDAGYRSGAGGYGGGGGGGGYKDGSFGGGGGGGGYTGGSGAGYGGSSFVNSGYGSVRDTASTQSGVRSGNGQATFAVCFTSGTLIRTSRGNVPIELLRAGEPVITASGEHRPIKWVGYRTLKCHGRTDLLPIRITAHAFGEGRPARDLFVSPGHALAVDVLGEVLIPAIRLVNGTTITQVERDEVTYLHVELDSHDILLAEGLPAESYLDCGNRRFFTNAEATDLLAVPDARPEGPLPFCRPFHEAGPLVDLARARLQDHAVALGWRKVEETFAGLYVVADGRTIRPDVQGLTARFVVPAAVRNVRLISETSVPAHVVPGSSDDRHLGVALAVLTIDDGLTGAREVALDDARFGQGFHPEDDGVRWTDGCAALPAALWAGCKGSFFLRVELAGPALPRWIAPGKTVGVINLADRRQA